MEELAKDLQDEEERRKKEEEEEEERKRLQREEEMKMLVSKLEDLKSPLEVPEYKDAYKVWQFLKKKKNGIEKILWN